MDPCFFRIAIVVSISDLRSGVITMCWALVLFKRWATPAAEFLGETAKAMHSVRMIPSLVVPYEIVSERTGGLVSMWQSGEARLESFTGVGQQSNNGLATTDLWFWQSE